MGAGGAVPARPADCMRVLGSTEVVQRLVDDPSVLGELEQQRPPEVAEVWLGEHPSEAVGSDPKLAAVLVLHGLHGQPEMPRDEVSGILAEEPQATYSIGHPEDLGQRGGCGGQGRQGGGAPRRGGIREAQELPAQHGIGGIAEAARAAFEIGEDFLIDFDGRHGGVQLRDAVSIRTCHTCVKHLDRRRHPWGQGRRGSLVRAPG